MGTFVAIRFVIKNDHPFANVVIFDMNKGGKCINFHLY